MSKHTPGPWEAFTQESFAGWWSVEDENCDEIGSGDGGFDEADARLIAAAPDLLEALEASNLLLRTQRHACESNEVCRVLDVHISRNNTAIAKAKGESA